MDFKNKYLKYKKKYLSLKNQLGGNLTSEEKLFYLKKFAGMYTFCSQPLNKLTIGRNIRIKLTNNRSNQQLDLGEVKVIYSKPISKLKKLDWRDIVNDDSYLVIFKEIEQEKYYVIIPFGSQSDFSDESEKNRWLKFSKDLYDLILHEINKYSSDVDSSVDKKTIMFFGHSAGGVLVQLILYQFYKNEQLENYNIGMITSGIFPIWEKKKDKDIYVKSLINKQEEYQRIEEQTANYDDTIFYDSDDDMKDDEMFKNKFKDKNIGDIIDFIPQFKKIKRRIDPSFLTAEQTNSVVYTKRYIHFNGMMIKNNLSKEKEFITVDCDIIFTNIIDLINNKDNLISLLNNNISDEIIINKFKRKIENINPLLNKSLKDLKYILRKIKPPRIIKTLNIDYTSLLEINWYNIDKDNAIINKTLDEYLTSDFYNIYTSNNINDLKPENKNNHIFDETKTAQKYILINDIILSIKLLDQNVLYLQLNYFFLFNIDDIEKSIYKDGIWDEMTAEKFNKLIYTIDLCCNNKKIINYSKDYFLDGEPFYNYIKMLFNNYMKEYIKNFNKEDNHFINNYLENNNPLTIEIFEEIEKFLYLNINLVSMNRGQTPDGYVMKKRYTTVFTIGRNNIYLLGEQSDRQTLRKCPNSSLLSCYSSLKKGCKELDSIKCLHDWKFYYKNPIKDLTVDSINF